MSAMREEQRHEPGGRPASSQRDSAEPHSDALSNSAAFWWRARTITKIDRFTRQRGKADVTEAGRHQTQAGHEAGEEKHISKKPAPRIVAFFKAFSLPLFIPGL